MSHAKLPLTPSVLLHMPILLILLLGANEGRNFLKENKMVSARKGFSLLDFLVRNSGWNFPFGYTDTTPSSPVWEGNLAC